jgi:hypothetical protein
MGESVNKFEAINLIKLPSTLVLSVFCDKSPGCGQTSCPHYYRPVCGTNGRSRKTFGNQCLLRAFNECSHDESE